MLAQIKKKRTRLNRVDVRAEQLTDRQAAVLSYMLRCWLCGYIPTVRDIAAEFGISSPNGAQCHITALRKKGFVANEPKCGFSLTDRAIRLAIGA